MKIQELDAIVWEALMAGCSTYAWTPNCTTHYAFVDEKNQFRAVPVQIGVDFAADVDRGREGAGARNFDGVEPQEALAMTIKALADRERSHQRGVDLTAAMGAMHAQRRADGRPVPYLPEETI